MDRMAIRNLLLNPKLNASVLKPMLYPAITFQAICSVVEGAILLEQKRGSKKVLAAVRRLKRIK